MPHNWVTRDSGARRRSPHFQSRLKLSSIWSAIRAVAGPDRACGWRPYDDSATDGNTRPGSGSSSHVLQPGIVAGRAPWGASLVHAWQSEAARPALGGYRGSAPFANSASARLYGPRFEVAGRKI